MAVLASYFNEGKGKAVDKNFQFLSCFYLRDLYRFLAFFSKNVFFSIMHSFCRSYHTYICPYNTSSDCDGHIYIYIYMLGRAKSPYNRFFTSLCGSVAYHPLVELTSRQ